MEERVPKRDLYEEFEEAVRDYWRVLAGQERKQLERGAVDQGRRAQATGGKQFDSLAAVVAQVFRDEGFPEDSIQFGRKAVVPGYYRPTKAWDVLIVHEETLVAAVELKSIGSSFGNNLSNRAEEAVGLSTDLLTAYREGVFGTVKPWLGYLFLMANEDEVHRPSGTSSTRLPIDDEFLNPTSRNSRDRIVSYSKRAEIMCRRLVLEQLYDASCFVLSSRNPESEVVQPSADLGFRNFAASIQGHARYIKSMMGQS